MYLNLGRCSKETHNSFEIGLLKVLSRSFSLANLTAPQHATAILLMPIKLCISIKTAFKVSPFLYKIKNNIEWLTIYNLKQMSLELLLLSYFREIMRSFSLVSVGVSVVRGMRENGGRNPLMTTQQFSL